MSSLSSCMRFGRLLTGGVQFLRLPFQESIRCVSFSTGQLFNNSTTAVKEENKTDSSSNTSQTNTSPEPNEKAASASPQSNPQLDELNKELEDVKKLRDEFSDKYKRSLADGENLRKRLTKQIEEAKIYGIQSFCKDLIEVADILGKATECVPKEEVKDSNPHLKNLYEGLTMTEAQLHKVFQRHGLSPVNPLNEKFNPNFHEALFQQEVEGKEAGTVVVVSKIGYKLHERVVRPALVGVAKG